MDESSEHWREEGVSFAAAYGGERVIADLLLAGGLPSSTLPAEVDPIHFTPRVRMPVLW